ncbi:hypothetical protein N7449_012342 [Penicillium cf. viridicatum]|uniref:Uncharacterized protein n=1 Tax=Penicillium cf. viridicatum TaxID=2972119 RepID=A0A9W9IPA3_9EURO|nr:hypothetical protein N7449_012342 [Penicillium cf. viridicatum]
MPRGEKAVVEREAWPDSSEPSKDNPSVVLFTEAMRIGEVGGVDQTTMWFFAIRSILDFPNSLHMGALFQKSVGHLGIWEFGLGFVKVTSRLCSCIEYIKDIKMSVGYNWNLS